MGIPVSLLLIAAGAILTFAVDATTNAVDLDTVGWILMIVGLVGLVLSVILWDTWAGGGYFTHAPARRRRVVREDVDDY